MIIRASVRLQRPATPIARQAFIPKGRADSATDAYEVVASSWAHVRRILKHFDVVGHSMARPDTVESYTKDLGTAPWGLRPR